MQRCLKCNRKFKYGELFKKMYNAWSEDYSTLTCSKCNAHHKPSKVTGIVFSILLFTPTLVFTNAYKYFGINRILFVVIWIILMVLLSPIYARYGLKDDKKND